MQVVTKQSKDAVSSEFQMQKANITLNPNTAHPRLILSEDHKSVRWGDKTQYLPDNPERFDTCHFVLACEKFTTGLHCWDVSVGSEGDWAVGVAKKSMNRKGFIHFSPRGGIWAMGKWGGVYRCAHNPFYSVLSLDRELTRIRVSLNCRRGEVAFHDADTGAHLCMFTGAVFFGQTLLPFFRVFGKAQLSICP